MAENERENIMNLISEKEIHPLKLQKVTFLSGNSFAFDSYSLIFCTDKIACIKINMNFKSDSFYFAKDVPTGNKEINRKVNEIIKDLSVYVRNDSMYRLQVVFQEDEAKVYGEAYNPMLRNSLVIGVVLLAVLMFLVPMILLIILLPDFLK